jgi:TonB family protein
MERIAKLAFVLFFASFLSFGQSAAATDPAAVLLQLAKALLEPGPKSQDIIPFQVIPLLRQANAIWGQSFSSDPQYAESLELLALLLRSTGKKDWEEEATPLVGRALGILDEQTISQPSAELALALELQADLLEREHPGESAGTEFWNRASSIRGQLVSKVVRIISAATSDQDVSVAAPPPAGPAVRVSQGVSQPKVITNVDPEYSEIARLAKYQCTVRFAIVVDAQGSARNLRLLRGCGYGLDEKAAEAVVQWRFQPGMKDDKPISVRATIEVNFRLL